MAQKIRSADGLLRAIPDPGQKVVYVISKHQLHLHPDRLVCTVPVKPAEGRRDQYPNHIRPSLLQQCSPPRYAFPVDLVLLEIDHQL